MWSYHKEYSKIAQTGQGFQDMDREAAKFLQKTEWQQQKQAEVADRPKNMPCGKAQDVEPGELRTWEQASLQYRVMVAHRQDKGEPSILESLDDPGLKI